MKHLTLFSLFISLVFFSNLEGSPIPAAHLTLGGGYNQAGCHHSGGVFQAEYLFYRRYFRLIRPQVAIVSPELRSLFIGGGLGVELYLSRHLIFIPSFFPGLYIRGSGKDLGCPLEFRSTLGFAYEWGWGFRLSFQYSHFSNGSISHKNPGLNTAILSLGFPL
ncbi:MAG: hypothetical protein K940chlam9_00820 [Chlamydiae bacterium]|nr:hypothetical protein [Chlamydiota bacterium]